MAFLWVHKSIDTRIEIFEIKLIEKLTSKLKYPSEDVKYGVAGFAFYLSKHN
jgi:hypothetical protein